MTTAYRLTPKAREGFLRIAFYVEDTFGPTVADQVVDSFLNAFELLRDKPHMGHQREDLTIDDCVRLWSVGPTLEAYRI